MAQPSPRWRAAWASLWRGTAYRVLLLAAATGVATGLGVAGFDGAASHLLRGVLDLPITVTAGAPILGLLLSIAALHWLGRRATPATADEYIRNFHDASRRLEVDRAPGRIAAAIATLGLGGALGYEGPAIYLGASVGTWLQQRCARWFSREDGKVLLVAGAAAGVAAIFKAPVTGLVFALEVPYQQDLARRTLLPAAIASAASYVTFVAFAGTAPLLPIAGHPPFDLVDVGGAALLGLACGLLARAWIALITLGKQLATRRWPAARAVVAGAVLGGLYLLGRGLAGTNLVLGAGYDSMRWALSPQRGLWLIAAVALMRALATSVTLAGGGVGGLFVPLVVQGALVGRLAAGLFGGHETTLFPVIGIAAFLGAGYRVPLAGVVFVAEFTGRPGFIVPGLIAAVTAQLVMGTASASPYQLPGRTGHLEHRLALPLAQAIDTEAWTAPSDASVEEVFWQHLVGTRQRTVPVVDDHRLVGLVGAEELAAVDREQWGRLTVADVMRTDIPVASPTWTMAEAVQAMEAAELDRLPVCDDGRYLGVVSVHGIVHLEEILDLVDPPADESG